MTGLQAFLSEQYTAEFQAFRTVLDAVPTEAFATATLGHSPAWHALHIAEWVRLTVLQDRTPNYHHLGWEDKPWVGPMGTEAAPVSETADKAAILAHLDDVGAKAVAYLAAASDTEMQGMTFSPSAPTGERPRLAALGMHVRHIAYHRGQVALGRKEQA
ncbi:DinB family protein [Deinococcus puniceus]|uniref:DinB-like domain-containing protein n=1 Tax=Deinococcus puniceus TaxID=1182568 RepID=A0A172T6D1_9DEIO|nr:DinB family protein [Deinococcus puniceus]ANE42605.1 hypothetical protein SU48_01210 [Deinococcus puniceus]